MHIYIYFYTATYFVLMNYLQSAVYQTPINQWIWKINEINSSIKWFLKPLTWLVAVRVVNSVPFDTVTEYKATRAGLREAPLIPPAPLSISC